MKNGSSRVLVPRKLEEFLSKEPPEMKRKRHELVDTLPQKGIDDPDVLEVLRIIPRHIFVPEPLAEYSYEDEPLPIGYDQTISTPSIVGLMTQNLHLDGTQKVLEVGTGSGYQTAVLALMSFKVVTIEFVQQLSCQAMQRLERIGIDNVVFIVGDGGEGWEPESPYDRIIVTAALPKFPEPLERQLKNGGIAVAPIGSRDEQKLYKIVKVGQKLDMKEICPCRFVPMRGKYGF